MTDYSTPEAREELLYNVVKELGHQVPDLPFDLDLFYRNWFWVGGRDYTTDLNAALELLPRDQVAQMTRNHHDNMWHVQIRGISGHDESLPVAICKAYLAWLEYRRAMKGEC